MNRTRRSSFRTRVLAAFSLIEVLISVLVLALGLLGLGAMFPVIIRQQRQATDATLGTMAANAARLELENNGIFRGTPSLPAAAGGPIGDPTPPDAWSVIYAELYARPIAIRSNLVAPEYEPKTGVMRVGSSGDFVEIPQAARLFPGPSKVGAQPRYVWDLVYHWAGANRIEAFIIVRPIDPNIRLTPGLNLSDVLAPTDASGFLLDPTRLAVSVNQTSRLPTFDGSITAADYSVPVEMDVRRVVLNDSDTNPENDRNRITLDPSGATENALAATAVRTGQKIIDKLGTIYTVVGIPKSGPAYTVLVDPPIPGSIEESDDIGPVMFVPQTPASVTKLTIVP